MSKNWEKYNENVYRIDILDEKNYSGYKYQYLYTFNVGFIEDNNGNKYHHKKKSRDQLREKFVLLQRWYTLRLLSQRSGSIRNVWKSETGSQCKTFFLASNMDISNLHFACTGGHALQVGVSLARNGKISNCLIEDIGGSYLDSEYEVRFGNSIEFYASVAENIEVTDNIIRNVYDVAFTIQGDVGSGKNVLVHDNVFVNNTQDSEIWEGSVASGVNNYQFYSNISVN